MTIKDIAEACGVSVSTVSRVLNGRPDVSAEVRAPPYAAPTQLSAQGLACHRHSKNIGQMKMCMSVPLNSATTYVPATMTAPQAVWEFPTKSLNIHYLS